MKKKQLFKVIFVFLSAFLLTTNCVSRNTEKQNYKNDLKQTGTISSVSKDENFEEFSKRFFKDSLFQISRIKFPLPGKTSYFIYGDDSTYVYDDDHSYIKNNQWYWKKNGWVFVKEVYEGIDAKDLKKTIKKNGNAIHETLRYKGIGWTITYDFRLIDGKWMLVYYGDEQY